MIKKLKKLGDFSKFKRFLSLAPSLRNQAILRKNSEDQVLLLDIESSDFVFQIEGYFAHLILKIDGRKSFEDLIKGLEKTKKIKFTKSHLTDFEIFGKWLLNHGLIDFENSIGIHERSKVEKKSKNKILGTYQRFSYEKMMLDIPVYAQVASEGDPNDF